MGGWVDSGIDPSLFSQALMYHAHRYSQGAWAGEPEIDPALDYEDREEIEGWEVTPFECLDLAYGGVLRERFVEAGEPFLFGCRIWVLNISLTRLKHGLHNKSKRVFWSAAIR